MPRVLSTQSSQPGLQDVFLKKNTQNVTLKIRQKNSQKKLELMAYVGT
jgi:hypothetical protein